MTRVGWLADKASAIGGAELTQAEFRAAAPDHVRIYDLQPGPESWPECDAYVIHNCVLYSADELAKILAGKPLVKYWHDVGPHLQPGVKEWLHENAVNVCCSPVQASYMGLGDVPCIPPPVDLARFEKAASRVNGNRVGAVCVGSWRNYGKAAHKVTEWAAANGGVDFFGGGVFAPDGSREVAYDDMPDLLARYERFVFLPMVLEPFGRTVVEAWAAGCEVVTNGMVGARYWIEHAPGAIDTAAADFWELALS